MQAFLFASLLLASFPTVSAQEDEGPPILRRYLVDLTLGDNLSEVKRRYPPSRKWPFYRDSHARVTRYRVERRWAKSFPANVQTLHLGLSEGRLVDIQVIYDEKFSHSKTYEQLAGDLALLYGEPRRSGGRFRWSDDATVLRVFPAEIQDPKRGAHAVSWRTSIQVYERGVLPRGD